MKQFGKILKFELKNYAHNKAFVGVTIALIAVISIVMFIPRIIDAFESAPASAESDGTSDISDERPVMLIRSASDAQTDIMKETFAAAFKDYDVQLANEDISVIKDKITSGEVECAFVMTAPDAFTYYVDNLTMNDSNTEIASEALRQIYQVSAMTGSGMSADEAINVINIQINSEVETLGKDQVKNFLFRTSGRRKKPRSSLAGLPRSEANARQIM